MLKHVSLAVTIWQFIAAVPDHICHQRCSVTLTKRVPLPRHWPMTHISNLHCLPSGTLQTFSGRLYQSEYDFLCSHSMACDVRVWLSGFVIRVNISTFNLDFMRRKSNLATSNICHWVRLKLGKMNVEREFNSNFVNDASALALFLWSAFRFWWAFHLIWDLFALHC